MVAHPTVHIVYSLQAANPHTGPLLELAADLALRLLPAFTTSASGAWHGHVIVRSTIVVVGMELTV
jgi:hypothetical protein